MTRIPLPPMKRPLVAILRGLRPDEAAGIVGALFDAGFTAVEIPLNSPEPFRSIEIAVKMAPPGALVGAGTVLAAADVDRLHDVGGRLLVAPNVDAEVLGRAQALGMATMPGVFTATEALAAAKLGASCLKFFPASVLGPGGIAAIRAILPRDLPVAAVGGVSEGDFARYRKAGVAVFGLGSSLYRAGASRVSVSERAVAAIRAHDEVTQERDRD